jgi:predicted DNA-binding transcriptional regulator YafY
MLRVVFSRHVISLPNKTDRRYVSYQTNLALSIDVFDSDYISSNNDGSYDLTVTMHEDEWVYGYILSLGKSAQVLEPEHIRKIIKAHAIEIAEKYN